MPMGKRFRSISRISGNFKGLECTTDEELEEIKATLQRLKVPYHDDQFFYNLNSNPVESKVLEGKYPEFKGEVQEYGFLSPAVMIIEAYVNFFMARYEKMFPRLKVDENAWQTKLKYVRDGLKAEKTFDLMLQNMALPVNYPEPIRDWREGSIAPFAQTSDFYVPCLGKLEVKSVTSFHDKHFGNFIDYRVNVPKQALAKSEPDYLVVLWHIGGRFVMLCGAMNAADVLSYEGTQYDISCSKPFLSIPLEHFNTAISASALYKALLEARNRINALEKIQIIAK